MRSRPIDPRRSARAGRAARLPVGALVVLVGCGAAGSAPAPRDAAATTVDGAADAPPALNDAAAQPAANRLDAQAMERPEMAADLAVAEVAGPSFDPCPPAGAACRVMALGDSLTFGVGSSGGGYRVPLFRQALQAKQAIVFVGQQAEGPASVDGVPFPRAHEGYRGYAIEAGGGRPGLSPLIDGALAAGKPHVVLLLAGTNDVGASVIDAGHAPDRLGALVDKIVAAAPDALVVVAQIPPCRDDATNKRIEAYNAALPAVIAARAGAGKHLLLVDGYGALTAQASYKTILMFNEFHPNDAGYALLAERWWAAVRPFLR